MAPELFQMEGDEDLEEVGRMVGGEGQKELRCVVFAFKFLTVNVIMASVNVLRKIHNIKIHALYTVKESFCVSRK